MSELHDLLERRAADYDPPADLLVRVRERSLQRSRNRRVASALAGVLITVVAIGGLARLLQRPDAVLVVPPDPFIGAWESIDSDGSTQTMDISVVDGLGYELVGDDDGASVCAGAPSTLTGTGQLSDAGLVFPAPVLVCDDGSTPAAVDGSSLADALRNYTLVHETDTDRLTDNLGVTWYRPGAAPDPGSSATGATGGMWPQSNLDEVREAQEKADAGDPQYTWQVDPELDAEQNVGTAEIFIRYLTERLGWEQFIWGTGYRESASDELRMVEAIFTRCAKGETNPLYPNDPGGRGCAPTVDDRTYQTVNVVAYQPLGTGPDDIWVVQRSYVEQPFRQTVPASEAEIAELMESFGQARIDGQGAEAFLEQPQFEGWYEIPLLYATTAGARYERFDYEVLDGPTWPEGTVNVRLRLFADEGQTRVEQKLHLLAPQDEWVLGYYRGSGEDVTTSENGVAVPEPYTLNFGTDEAPVAVGAVTFARPPSWRDECCISGEGIVDFHHEARREAEVLVVPDPLPPTDGCGVGGEPVSADELIRSVRSSDVLSATAKKAARVGSIDVAQVDVSIAESTPTCQDTAPILAPRAREGGTPEGVGVTSSNQSRLYVFDVPGTPAHTVAILITAPKPDFDRALEAARPILDSFQLATE